MENDIAVIAHNTMAINGDTDFLERGAVIFVGDGDAGTCTGTKIIVSK
ncbi:MAG: hypothetical protein MUF81_20020 [Verrucomicrobia bacterium]|nr:hypothetical protein [Verrucomicrobiota bacterium]